MLAWLRRMIGRRPSPQMLRDAERYRRVLHKTKDTLPDDPTIERVVQEFERAEQAMRSSRG